MPLLLCSLPTEIAIKFEKRVSSFPSSSALQPLEKVRREKGLKGLWGFSRKVGEKHLVDYDDDEIILLVQNCLTDMDCNWTVCRQTTSIGEGILCIENGKEEEI